MSIYYCIVVKRVNKIKTGIKKSRSNKIAVWLLSIDFIYCSYFAKSEKTPNVFL